MKACTKPLLWDANYDRENNDYTDPLTGVIFPQILYDFDPYDRHFPPVKFFPNYYYNKRCFELPQNVTWTDESDACE